MTQAIRVAYQGEAGAFSEAASRKLLGEGIRAIPFRSFEEMFASVPAGVADCCVVPIENSLAGSIHRNYDLLLASGLSIAGETSLRIEHALIAPPGTALGDLRRVYSHPVALAQCGTFLRRYPQIEAIPMYDTAGAVQLVMRRQDPGEAAIASAWAARIYGGALLASNIEDDPQNYTRFFLIAPPRSGIAPSVQEGPHRWKTSLLLHIANQPGSLYRALGVLALAGIDLSKIESRPIAGRPWEYAFYIDIIGNVADPALASPLAELRLLSDSVIILGSYPTAW
jgi:prephenate dehydratase